MARGPGDRGIADRRDLGRVPPGIARRRADAGAERPRPAGCRDRTPPQWHPSDPGQRCRRQRLCIERASARDRPPVLPRTVRRPRPAPPCRGYGGGGRLMRLVVNGAEADIAVSTIAELLAEQGVDPKARFLAVAVNGAVVRRAEWPAARLAAGDSVEIARPFQGG